MRLFLPHVLYTVWCLSKSYTHNNNCKNKKRGKRKKKKTEKKNTTAQIGTNVMASGFNAGLLEVSMHPEGPVTSQLNHGFP
jgi:hypothetical protein